MLIVGVRVTRRKFVELNNILGSYDIDHRAYNFMVSRVSNFPSVFNFEINNDLTVNIGTGEKGSGGIT